jgi:hypothetical protein
MKLMHGLSNATSMNELCEGCKSEPAIGFTAHLSEIRRMTGPAALTLSLLMLAGVLLTAGGIMMLVRRRDRTRGLLMLATGLVMFGNVAIWTLPLS